MQLTEHIRINAPRERVFAALNDVEILRQAIPGCEAIEALSPTDFKATVSAKVGPLKARFTGAVAIADIVAPESYTLSGEGKGGPAGHARISSRVRLEADGAATILHYDVKADIGGKLAQLGGSLVEKTAQKLAGEFFAQFETLLNPPDMAPADAALTETPPAPSSGQGQGQGKLWLWIAGGVVLAALIALLAR
ncbi:MAG: carbon monoxide dehydrogenase subunit G [Proteobacteria bacterium]|nr:carbon monoxide dehydrogenase subunit G [Pseudomonadota bacterium]